MDKIRDWQIVLIDDEEDIRDVMSIVLRDEGFSVAAAENGKQGLALCETLRPQIVITDVRMPGMDGIQVLEAVKKKVPDTEVIVVTAFGEMALAVRALQLDASDFITKPIDDAALLIALDRAGERYAARKALRDYTAFLEKEKAKTARELIKTYSLQKNLIENSMDGILACDANGEIVLFNRQMETMLGHGRKDVVGSRGFASLFEDAAHAGALRTAMAGPEYGGANRLFLYETRLKSKTCDLIPVQVSAAALGEDGNEAGGTAGWVCFFRDLRRIRKLERELSDQASILHQDKMMSLGRLSASVVHEINNPLFGVLNYVRLMIRKLDRGEPDSASLEKFKGYLGLVEKETERCSTIISGLLAFSRKAEPSFGEVNLSALLGRCILLSSHKLELSNITLARDISEDLPPIRGDANQLQQSLINLIFNAIDAMPNGGTLTLGCRPEGEFIAIRVEDTGSGIDPKDLEHIFEPFFTTKKEGYGVGLGLSTVYGIIEHHKGRITAQSKPGHTVFKMMLPKG